MSLEVVWCKEPRWYPSQPPYHCLVMSNIMTTPLQFLYTSRNSASRAISDSAWGQEGVGHERRGCGWGPTGVDPQRLGKAEQDFYNLKRQQLCSFWKKHVSTRLSGVGSKPRHEGSGSNYFRPGPL